MSTKFYSIRWIRRDFFSTENFRNFFSPSFLKVKILIFFLSFLKIIFTGFFLSREEKWVFFYQERERKSERELFTSIEMTDRVHVLLRNEKINEVEIYTRAQSSLKFSLLFFSELVPKWNAKQKSFSPNSFFVLYK